MNDIITIPERISSDFSGYDFLSDLNARIEKITLRNIIIDFSGNVWFEANLCAVLGAIINQATTNFNNVFIQNLNPKQKDIFSRNHFLASFGGEKIADYGNTTIKYRRNRLTDDKLIKEFLDNELINKPDFPKLSEAAKKEIIRSIFEIYSNAVIHGDCKDVFSCGQFYPQKQPPRIDFTIADFGKTIKKNVFDFLQKEISGIDAIKWALEENNTTKPKEDNIPGGLGFKLICDFVRLNKGQVQIVSSDGYWQMTNGTQQTKTLNKPFPGTIVNIEFNLDDKSFYSLKNEKQNNIIF